MPITNPNPMEIPMKTKVELCELILAEQADNVASLHSHEVHVSAKLAEAKAKVATLADKRKQIAIDAALDKTGARDTLAAVNDDLRTAEIDVEALSIALSVTRSSLVDAEEHHAAAVVQLRKAQGTALIVQRIAAAAKFDEAQRLSDEALAEYDAILRAIPDVDDSAVGWGTVEQRIGVNRVRSAVSPRIKKMFNLPNDHASLEATEKAVWGAVLR
jgi:hypothetical protein